LLTHESVNKEKQQTKTTMKVILTMKYAALVLCLCLSSEAAAQSSIDAAEQMLIRWGYQPLGRQMETYEEGFFMRDITVSAFEDFDPNTATGIVHWRDIWYDDTTTTVLVKMNVQTNEFIARAFLTPNNNLSGSFPVAGTGHGLLFVPTSPAGSVPVPWWQVPQDIGRETYTPWRPKPLNMPGLAQCISRPCALAVITAALSRQPQKLAGLACLGTSLNCAIKGLLDGF
jgi:hypothetical protein